MKTKSQFVPPITDWIITDRHGTGKNFDDQLRLWVKNLKEEETLPKYRYDHQPEKWPLSGSWLYRFASKYLDDAERLLKEKNLYFNDEIETTFRELRSLFNKYNHLKTFLLTLRIATITYRAGLIPDNAKFGEKWRTDQSIKASKDRARNGMTPSERKIRDEKIFDDFKKERLKNRHLTINAFSNTFTADDGPKPRQVRTIISKMAVGS